MENSEPRIVIVKCISESRLDDNEDYFECPSCKVKFIDEISLKNHTIKRHKTWLPGSRAPVPRHNNTCHVCGWKGSTQERLHDHIYRNHSMLRPYSCKKCDKTFKSFSNLTSHEKRHDKANPYTCYVCNKAFIDRGSYNRHKKAYVGEHFSCDLCGRSFKYKAELESHIKGIHNTSPMLVQPATQGTDITCEECKKTFSSTLSLSIHKQNHELEKNLPKQPPPISTSQKAVSSQEKINKNNKDTFHEVIEIPVSEVTSNLVYTAATNKQTIPTNPNKVSTYGTLLQNFEASNLEELICLNPYNTNLIQNQSKQNGNYIPTSSKENNININLGTEILSVVSDVELNHETLFPLDLISVPVNPALVQPLQNNHQQQGGLSHHEAQRHQEQLLAVQSGYPAPQVQQTTINSHTVQESLPHKTTTLRSHSLNSDFSSVLKTMGTEEMLNVLDNSLSAAGPGVNDVHLSSTLNSEVSKDASIQQNIVSMQPIGVDNILFSKPVEMPQESIFPLQPVLMEIDSDDCSETELIEEESCYIVEAFDDNPQNNSVNPVVINQQEITINPFTSIEVNNELKTKEVVEILPDLETGNEKPNENTEDTNHYKGNIHDIVTDFNIVDTETAKALKRDDSLSFITIKEVFHESDKLEIDPETALTHVENDDAVKPIIFPPKAIHPTEKRRSIMEYSIVEPEPNLSFDSMPMFENENDP